MNKCISAHLSMVFCVFPLTGCGPSVDPEDLGTILYEVPDVPADNRNRTVPLPQSPKPTRGATKQPAAVPGGSRPANEEKQRLDPAKGKRSSDATSQPPARQPPSKGAETESGK